MYDVFIAGGPVMDRMFFFDFDSRTWSCRMCACLLPAWTFGHATKRGRSIFAFGSAQGETGTLEVGGHPAGPVLLNRSW